MTARPGLRLPESAGRLLFLESAPSTTCLLDLFAFSAFINQGR